MLPVAKCAAQLSATQAQNIELAIDYPTVNGTQDIFQRLTCDMPVKNTFAVTLECKQIHAKDTILVYSLAFDEVVFNKGPSSTDLLFDKINPNKTNTSFLKAIQHLGTLPPGIYLTNLDIVSTDSTLHFHKQFYNEADSNLAYNSPLRLKTNEVFSSSKISGKASVSNLKNQVAASKSALKTQVSRIHKKLRSEAGISVHPEITGGKTYSALYYEQWFLGRYEIVAGKGMQDKIAGEADALKNNAGSLVSNNLEDFSSVSGQLRALFAKGKEDKETLKGNVDLNQYLSNGQEAGSAQDNNYTEFRAQVETRVFDMPVSMEGFYTTQDAHRQAKASYIRFHYDVETAKEELQKKINTYRNKFGETVAKGQGLQMMYGSYLNNLESEKGNLLNDLTRNYGISEQSLKNNHGNIDQLLGDLPHNIDTTKLLNTAVSQLKSAADSNQAAASATDKLQAAREKIEKDKAAIKKRYDRLVALEQQYEKYKTLLDQYKTQLHLDSALTYNKIQSLSKGDQSSYKELLKSSSELLPEGKVKQFTSGLTHFDAGIINQYESDYTMAGQNLKGLSTGYDLGFVKAGVTIGKTQYVSRDGSVDNYNSYLGKLTFKPFKNQQLELLYFGYSPAVKTLEKDSFYQHTDIAGDNYKEPVTVVSLNYQGEIGKNIQAQVEGATSMKKGQDAKFDLDHSAVKTSVDFLIPKTTAELQGTVEHTGIAFENSTLPYSMAGTDKYTLATTADLFRSFLTVGVQLNYMEQNSFASKGYSTKWGFDIKTHSKRYPSFQLSYKPFSTFRNYSDTLNIPQRPMTGEVWTGRASYQIKKHKIIHRFTLVYNQNTSNMDSVAYSSRMAQAGYILTVRQDSYTLTTGWTSMPVSDTSIGVNNTVNLSTWFASVGGSKSLTPQVSVSLAEEIAIADFGLQRMSSSAGVQYRFARWPLALRMQLRYTNYKLTEQSQRTNLYAGQLGLNWQFKMKRG